MESINNNLQEIENVNAGELMIENPNVKVSNNNIPKLNLNLENYDLNKLNNNPSSSTELPLSTPRISSVHTILFIREGYYFIKSIAKGGYGEVFLAITKSNKFFAIKVINKHDAIKKDMVEELMVERNILENYQNQSIVKFFESFEKNEEHEAKNIIAQIVNGLEFIHSCGIIHRDLKLDNLIFDKNGIIKIVDFGFSEIGFTGDNGENNNKVINNSGYGKTVDWWALGIIIFEMLSGQPPFISKNPDKIFRKINKYIFSWFRFKKFLTKIKSNHYLKSLFIICY
ncbi:hypothetical protein ACTFIR_009692 [Dictyostelium discoideum]